MSSFDRIIGYDGIKKELERFCDVLRNSEKYESLGVTIPCGILFYGEPGIGKTLMAKCFIEASGCKAYTIRKDKPDGDFTNTIRENFEKAKQERKTIVFLDDMDKFANEDMNHPDAEEYVTVQACIDDSRDHDVFVIATVNDLYCLPESLLRTGRFDKIIRMDSPSYEDTIKIVDHYLKSRVISDDIETEEIARIMRGRPISDIKAVINEAGINAGYEGRQKIERADLITTMVRLIINSTEKQSAEGVALERIIIHEVGHVVVAETLERQSVSLISVEWAGDDVGGITMVRKNEKSNAMISREDAEFNVLCSLGGRAASDVIFGEPDIGSTEDIEEAYKIVKHLVTRDAITGLSLSGGEQYVSGELEDKQNLVVPHILELYYLRAKKIIAQNRDLLIRLADELREKKTMTSKDIRKVIGNDISC